MLYGSQGFSSYGYQAGCAFATASFETAIVDPDAARYLCPVQDTNRLFCEHDHSVSGVCFAPPASDGFIRVTEVRSNALAASLPDMSTGSELIGANWQALYPPLVNIYVT